MPTPILERLLKRVRKTETCWLWEGATDGKYGHIGRGSHAAGNEKVHRVMWAETYGPIPAGLKVLHRCDIMLCVRPTHLFLGTQSDNMKDMMSKNRHPSKKLSSEDKVRMKAMRADGKLHYEIARVFGVTRSRSVQVCKEVV